MISQSGTRLEEDRISYSPTSTASTDSVKQSSMLMELSTRVTGKDHLREKEPAKERVLRKTSADASTGKLDVVSQRMNVTTSISAKDVEREDMVNSPAWKSTKEITYGMRPMYL